QRDRDGRDAVSQRKQRLCRRQHGALGSNSALNLSNVSGNLELYNGASISVAATTGNPTGALLNSGGLYVDNSQAGSSSLKVAGKLTNLGIFELGNASLTATDQATVGGLANVGT